MKSLLLLFSFLFITTCSSLDNYNHSLIGTKTFTNDTSAIISVGSQTFKITDTSIFHWDKYLFIYKEKDSSDFLRDEFIIYDVLPYSWRYRSGTYLYLTNGKVNLIFDAPTSWNSVKIGDKFYCFYKIESTSKTEKIK